MAAASASPARPAARNASSTTSAPRAGSRTLLTLSATALVALFPELEPLLGAWRRRYTGDGLRGMPPHVTLIFPFADSSEVDDVLEPLERVFAAFTPFEFALRQTARFPGAPLPPAGTCRDLRGDHGGLGERVPRFPALRRRVRRDRPAHHRRAGRRRGPGGS